MTENKNNLDDLEFEVMPQSQDQSLKSGRTEKSGATEKPGKDYANFTSNSKLRVWLISALALFVIAGLGFAAYYFIASSPDDPSRVNEITVPEQDSQEDTDSDGLTDQKERELGTDDDDPDTDKDGLADGDEVNIYLSDPLLQDTDLDTFNDGDEVARGFSPVVNTSEPASQDEKSAWKEREQEFGLHEPTITTLRSEQTQDSEGGDQILYMNSVFQYSLQIPDALNVRESSDGTVAGFVVKGSQDPDPDVSRDPITVSVAIKPAEQSIEEWADTFLTQGEDYESKSAFQAEGIVGIRYSGMKGQVSECPMDQIHFAKENDSRVFAISLTCNELEGFVELFTELSSTFSLNSTN